MVNCLTFFKARRPKPPQMGQTMSISLPFYT